MHLCNVNIIRSLWGHILFEFLLSLHGFEPVHFQASLKTAIPSVCLSMVLPAQPNLADDLKHALFSMELKNGWLIS